MQLQSFLAMLFIFVVLPVFLLFSNHNIFYIAMALVLLFDSLRSIYFLLTGKKIITPDLNEDDKEFIDDLKNTTGFDLKWFNTCIKIARYLIAILFYIYCSFYVKNMFLNILISIVILYWVNRIINSFREENIHKIILPFYLERIIQLLINTSSAFVITIITLIKFKIK
ncbi:MAG: hypothetical protein GYA02_03940 [Clostridiaceae bacterium]|nr:hypothetical protein [Clostridiaceae bacterium]